MSWGATAIFGGTVVGGYLSSKESSKASREASRAQVASSQLSVEEQRRQFDEIQKLLSPYIEAGTGALAQQQALLGLAGPKAEQAAIQRIEQSPQFQALTQQGEEAILQRASATGGLRGGDTQAALAQFRPGVLSSLIEDRFSKFGGLSSLGQASAVGAGGFGQQTSSNISNLLQQQGAARAGQALAQGKIQSQLISDIVGAGSQFISRKF